MMDYKTVKKWSLYCYYLALEAKALGELPIAAIAFHNGEYLGEAHNIGSLHAERILLQYFNLSNLEIIVNLEPCLGCKELMKQYKVNYIYFGACETNRFSWEPTYFSGFFGMSNSHLIRSFFKRGDFSLPNGELI